MKKNLTELQNYTSYERKPNKTVWLTFVNISLQLNKTHGLNTVEEYCRSAQNIWPKILSVDVHSDHNLGLANVDKNVKNKRRNAERQS